MGRQSLKSSLQCALASVALVLAGCATEVAPALKHGVAPVTKSDEGMALLGLTLANTFRVTPMIAQIETVGLFVDGPEHDPKPHGRLVDVDKPLSRGAASGRQVEEHLISIGLPPGKYRLRCVQTTVAKSAWGCAPLFSTFEITPGTVAYLGHIDILRRERKNDAELRAGSILPVFDQWYAGYSSGTFDVAIRDAFEVDIDRFRARYPSLGGTQIAKSVLPAWHAPTAAEAGELP